MVEQELITLGRPHRVRVCVLSVITETAGAPNGSVVWQRPEESCGRYRGCGDEHSLGCGVHGFPVPGTDLGFRRDCHGAIPNGNPSPQARLNASPLGRLATVPSLLGAPVSPRIGLSYR